MAVVISVENVSKAYRLGVIGGGTLKEDVARWWAKLCRRPDPLLKIGQEQHSRHVGETFWALDKVSFQVNQGEVLGIIGGNGAGKSTLLKILSQVTAPTSGEIKTKGRIASLLEVGTGFHPELTGRENIFLNGAILGMSQAEVRRKLDEIIAFSEIEEFIDTPVKRYSSGMYVRLAFAVAAHLEPEILIVDEVLAVGDASFQKKCLGKMNDVAKNQGRTVLFVSHNMAATTRLCQRVLWMERGQLRGSGETEEVVAQYLGASSEQEGEVVYGRNGKTAPGSDYVTLEAVRIRSAEGLVSTALDVRRGYSVEVQYRILRRAANLRIGVTIIAQDGTVVLSSKDMDNCDELVREPGSYLSRCSIPGEFLNYGNYHVSVGSDFPMVQSHFHVEQALGFRIEATGGVGSQVSDGRRGLLRMRLPWQVEKIGA